MRNNKDRWSFYKLPDRPHLSAEEVLYWNNTLNKILKIGLEFEFNLPEKKGGTCKGNSSTCPCINLSLDNECWQQCANKDSCDTGDGGRINICSNVIITGKDKCKPENCSSCEKFSIKCSGLFCSKFVSFCCICPDYHTDCKPCKFLFDPNKSPENIRKRLQSDLKPNNSYGLVSKSGVHSITTDGSLLGKKGAEVITTGRRIDYWEFYKMSKRIINSAVEKGGYLNERCSIHMHVLASYYGNITPDQGKYGEPTKAREMERNLPEIVLANLHQLVRRYQNAMTWMTMALNEQNRMTRWEKYRVSVLPISAVMHHMKNVKAEVSRTAGGNKYGWINYNSVGFSRDGNVSRLHVEFRAADGLLSPSATAAIACMYYALVIKAVNISRYGVVEIGDKRWMDQAGEVKDSMLNNMKGYQDEDRFADTSNIHKYYNVLITESLDFVRQLKSILTKVGPAYEVLEKLAECPIAIRRCDGQTWAEIEEDLQIIMSKEDYFDVALSEIITLNQVSECKDFDEWTDTVSAILKEDIDLDTDGVEVGDNIRSFIEKNRDDGKLVWSNSIGGPITI